MLGNREEVKGKIRKSRGSVGGAGSVGRYGRIYRENA